MFSGRDGARKVATLAVTCLGFFMVLLDSSIVTVALPSIQSGLHANLSDLQWVVDAYTLPFAVLLLSAGTLGDRFGRKRLFLTGLAGFTLGSGLCALAPDLRWLIVGRALQGAGGAALAPGSLSLLSSAFVDPRERIEALGLWSGIAGIATAAGPLIGGLLIQVADWPAIFLVNLPIGVLALAWGGRALVESRNPAARQLDLLGQALAVAGLLALTFSLIEGNRLGWGSPVIVVLLIGAVGLLVGFVAVEARSAEPMLPFALFRSVVVSAAAVSVFILGFALFGTVFFLSQYFQAIQGFSALQTGLRVLPFTLGLFVVSPFAGRIAARYGFRPPILGGALVASVGLLLFADIAPTTPYAVLWWKLALIGLGYGVMQAPLTSAVMTATPPARAGVASSMVNASRQLGAVFGVALLGAIVEGAFGANLATRLVGAGVPAGQSQRLAGALAQAGSFAARAQSSSLPVDVNTLRNLSAVAFTDALHVAYVVAGFAVLLVAAMALTLLSAEPVESVQPDPGAEFPAIPADVA